MKRRILIPNVRNKDGEAEKTRQNIANVFAKFYEDLYKGEDDHNDEDMSSCIDHENADSSQIETIPEFTTEEIIAAINRLKKGKAGGSSGIRAEQLRICSDDIKEKIRTIFNEIAQQDFTPNSWRRIRIQVSTKRETERTLAITGRNVGYLFCTNYLRRSCMHGSPQVFTKYNHRTRLV